MQDKSIPVCARRLCFFCFVFLFYLFFYFPLTRLECFESDRNVDQLLKCLLKHSSPHVPPAAGKWGSRWVHGPIRPCTFFCVDVTEAQSSAVFQSRLISVSACQLAETSFFPPFFSADSFSIASVPLSAQLKGSEILLVVLRSSCCSLFLSVGETEKQLQQNKPAEKE